MRTFTLTNKAKADLKSIAAYTQRQWGKDQRKTYIRQFDDSFYMLSKTPELGNKCDFIKQGYRKFPVSSHILFYHNISQFKIEFVRILHKRMDSKIQFEIL
ncbi:MAG: type II toxin-antitoxin system RelE/ParE family toxin [Methylococcales symbiont of Hymedesmia sp. n. MRB-2018]|nr:MAG: type II toxin-antitoxin system RelE/ParE family toxin [Methylococcales symbiont of Hymedesmia sp. n. MRB-2018]KAF3984247.1 MAG: type II toxin-antitoxin system RelE/ParE family toxin [Methylococcales symbiont of Hymedesmia sp. n. MRB-2018]